MDTLYVVSTLAKWTWKEQVLIDLIDSVRLVSKKINNLFLKHNVEARIYNGSFKSVQISKQ